MPHSNFWVAKFRDNECKDSCLRVHTRNSKDNGEG